MVESLRITVERDEGEEAASGQGVNAGNGRIYLKIGWMSPI
jgi:hypothetical protein